MSDAPHQRRSAWPLVVGFAVLAVLITAAGYWAWRQQAQSIQRQTERSLAAVGELKADQITTWLEERRGDAEMIRDNPLLSAAVADMLAGHDVATATVRVQTFLESLRRSYDYQEIAMTSPRGAVLLRAPRMASDPLSRGTKALVTKATATGRVESSDLYLDAEGNSLLDVAAPLPGSDGGIIACVILRSDLNRFLYPLVQRWPLPSRSGETLLVERRGDQVVYLNELRFRKDAAFKLMAPLSTPDRPSAMAVRGRRGIVQGIDYRGVPVLAAIQRVAGTPWFIVAKEDTDEILGPIRTRGWLTAGLAILLVVLAGLGTLLLWRARESHTSAEIRESEEKFRSLFEHMAQGVVYEDAEGHVVSANASAEGIIGLSVEQMQGLTATDPPWQAIREDGSDPSDEEHPLSIALRTGREVRDVVTGIRNLKADENRWIKVSATPQFRPGENEPYQVFATFGDITELVVAEQELRETSDYLENLFGYANAPVIVWDPELRITRFNRAFEDLTGRSVGEVVGKHLELLFPDDERRARALDHVTSATAGERWQVVEIPILRADGEVRTVLWNSATVYGADAVTSIATIAQGQDITERKRAEEELRESEERLRFLIDQTPTVNWTLDGDLRFTLARGAGLEALGLGPDQVLGMYFGDYLGGSGPQADLGVAMQRRALAGESFTYEQPIGDLVFDIIVGPLRGADGTVVGAVGVAYDATERKRAEEELRETERELTKLNVELEQRVIDRTTQLDAANKELEAFAYSVSHDLRAPLRHISGFSSLLAERIGEALDEKSSHYLDTISRSVREMGVLIDDLLHFSRTGRAELKIEPVDMDATLAEALQPLQTDSTDRDIEWSIGSLPHVVGDSALLRQVWANLLGNAVKYTRDAAPARIEVGARDGDEADEDVFWVRDNGVGFDMQFAHKLFGVFQRLHSASEFEGTGIGLANVQRIINRLGGRVWAEGEVDHGATFYFSLPRRKETPS